ncbi:MAG: alkaline phosphatase family protein [Candidatus Omnitrophica bacterium]|nr:alkaline phosphatase family protein [Candidatus Omnitrophota bacterium]MDD5236933.1 alkaline phosphatase family protein [Candidatus Omnitrophota bacterium]MDD5610178.1 alkaline phosphatase family protein [Candidatus Omnitrophota bacterium]
MKKRVIIIGLDGVPYELIRDLSEKGIMPNVTKLLSRSSFRKMRSSIPEVSCVAWSSIITGKNPAEHGIFGFTDLCANSYKLRFPDFNDLKSRPFWENSLVKSVVINVPSTYPARPMNGIHISGFVSIEIKKSVYPSTLVPVLESIDYRLDVDSDKAHKSMDLFLEDLEKALGARIKTYEYLWDKIDWEIFMLVFTETDRLMHFLWNAYLDTEHKYHQDFLKCFKKIDNVIGDILSKIKESDSLIMLSDHGFEKLECDVYINWLLKENTFLDWTVGEEAGLENINSSTKAFALDPARIYVNTNVRFPRGSIKDWDKDKVLRDLESLFTGLTINGRKVIKSICRKEQIYSGPYLEVGPDLILLGNTGFNLRASLQSQGITGKGIFTGKHTQDNGFLILADAGGEINIPEYPSVCDFTSIINGLNN